LLLGTRAYAPKWRRFLQPDAFDWRRYTYVHGDPSTSWTLRIGRRGARSDDAGNSKHWRSPDNLSYTIGIRAFAGVRDSRPTGSSGRCELYLEGTATTTWKCVLSKREKNVSGE